MAGKEFGDNLGPLIIGSFFKDDFPWLYEVAAEVYRKLETNHPDASDALRRFTKLIDRIAHHPMMYERHDGTKDQRFEMEEMMMFSRHMLERIVVRTEKANSVLNTDAADKQA